MKFNTSTMQGVKSTRKQELVVIYVETNGLEDSLVHYIKPESCSRGCSCNRISAMLIAGNKDDLDKSDHLYRQSVLMHCTACALNVPSNCTIHRLKSVTVSKTYSSKVKLILQSTPLRDLCSHESDTLPFSHFGICYTSMLCMYKCMLAWSVQLTLYMLELLCL